MKNLECPACGLVINRSVRDYRTKSGLYCCPRCYITSYDQMTITTKPCTPVYSIGLIIPGRRYDRLTQEEKNGSHY